MMNCWSMDPTERHSFSEIARTLSGYTETLAGYLDMNPFLSKKENKPTEDGFNNDILTHPDQLAALDYYNIPKNKSRSPRSSPRASPRASPLHSPSATATNNRFMMPPTSIKIQIDSCSPPS